MVLVCLFVYLFVDTLGRCGVSTVQVSVHLDQAVGLSLAGQQSTMGSGIVLPVSGLPRKQDLERLWAGTNNKTTSRYAEID